jgi:ribonuclease D
MGLLGPFVIMRERPRGSFGGAEDVVVNRREPSEGDGEQTNRPASDPTPRRGRKLSYRSRHREASHREAHQSEADSEALGKPVIEHPLVAREPAAWITTAAGVDELVEHLQAAGAFAFDSEFIGEETYRPLLCVVQVATPQRVALIDGQAGLDLTGLWKLIGDPRLETLVHAGRQDFQIVHEHLGRAPQRVFDVQIAAAFAGYRYPMSLRDLVQAVLGVALDAGPKFSQWDRRPLTATQMHYAANDVRYLPAIGAALREKLVALGNERWALAACAELEEDALYQFDPQNSRLRVRSAESLGRRRTAVLHRLLVWRQEAARENDVPPRSLLRDEVLHRLAREPVQTMTALRAVKGLPRPVLQRYGPLIVEATRLGLTEPLTQRTHRKARDPEKQRAQVQALWSAIQERCHAAAIDPAVVTSKRELDAYLLERRVDGEPMLSRLGHGWRDELMRTVLSSEST